MTVINPLMNITHGAIEPGFFSSYSVMASIAVSSFHISIVMFVSHDGMVHFWSIRSQERILWGVIEGGQITNRVSRCNRNRIWKRIRNIEGYFVWSVTITNWHGRVIQRQDNTINQEGNVEIVIKCTVLVLYHHNFYVPDFL